MPGWQRTFDPHVKAGTLTVIGVVQEQHGDRARLYRQWKDFDWPIFVDALNVLQHRVVPIPMAIDANGRIMGVGRRIDLDALLKTGIQKPALKKTAPENVHPEADACFYKGDYNRALAGYRKGADAATQFKLGCALRARYESDQRLPGDGQAAVAAWGKALALMPNQYIWRRRIQQYGPRLAKPYNFYDWVNIARQEIEARGQTPTSLAVEPRGAELLGRTPEPGEQPEKPLDPDPQGKILRDAGLVQVEIIATPAAVRPGHAVRVRLVLRLKDALWNNEGGALTLSVDTGDMELREGTFTHPILAPAETTETRYLEFEVVARGPGQQVIPGYLLYYVCKKKGGTCLYLRQDFKVRFEVSKDAAAIQR